MILGLDISTSITGATVMDIDGNCLYNEFWDIRNKNLYPTMYHKAREVQRNLYQINFDYLSQIKEIYVEEPFTFFNSGGSTGHTMATLQKFNGIVCWMCYDMFEKQPKMITSASARSTVGIKLKRGEKAKKKSFDFVLANEPKFVVEYTRHGNPRPGMMDKSDSWVIAKAGLILCKEKN